MELFSIERIVFVIPAILIALSFHEFAHAFVADRLGDSTPRLQGRVSLDIRKHLDPFGTIMLLFTGFGWGKPVQTDPRNLQNPKTGMALISLAGPVMNIFLAIISAVIFYRYQSSLNYKFQMLISAIFQINAGLAIFNLIPIPPLDGSKVISVFLTNKAYFNYMVFQAKYQMFLILGLFLFIQTDFLMKPLQMFISFLSLVGYYIANILPF